jgi:hypothetical protein
MDRDPREVVLEQLVAELPGKTMPAEQVVRGPSAAEVGAVLDAEIGRVSSSEMLAALTQLLIDKRLLDRDELGARVRALRKAGFPR